MSFLGGLLIAPSRAPLSRSASAFGKWLSQNPIAGDRSYGSFGIGYQVTRYCEYLQGNRWMVGDPLRDADARDGAVRAYKAYLETFNTPAAMIATILASIDRFYIFLGMGAVNLASAESAAASKR